MPAQSPAERSLIARVASHTSWAHTDDPQARTAPGREKFAGRFAREVDPDGTLPEVERARRAEHARKAYFAGLALKSAQARRARAHAAQLDAEVEAGLADVGGDAA